MPPVLGRDQEGRLVFGWCARCLEETGCTPVETTAANLVVRRPPLKRQVRTLHRRFRIGVVRFRTFPWNSPAGRRLVLLGLTLILLGWSLVLAVVGACRWIWPGSSEPSPTGNGTAALFIAGSALMGLLGMGLLIWLARPARRVRIVTSLVTLASGSSCVLSLALWVFRPIPGQWLSLAIASFVAFLLCWFLGHRLRHQRGQPGASLSERPG